MARFCVVVFVGVFAVGVFAACGASRPELVTRSAEAPPPLWGALRAGRYEVGFRHLVLFDATRVYGRLPDGDGPARAAAKTVRPVLIAMWYPADAVSRATPRARYRDYIAWPLRGTPAAHLADDVAAYERTELAVEVLGAERSRELTPGQVRELEALLATEMAGRPGATPAPGRFPLVIYSPGALGSPVENFLLCEYLASHGYVVAAGSFLSDRGISFGQQSETQDALLDVHLILHRMAGFDDVDPRRFALVGHSAGAQDALQFAVENPAVDAVVSLDTTWDYPANQRLFADNPALRRFKDGAQTAAVPVLAFAHRGADYAPFAGMTHARRIYVTVDDLVHDEFMAHGAIGASHQPREPGAPAASLVRAQYEVVCRYVVEFLDATLAGSADAKKVLALSPAEAVPGVDGVHVERHDGAPRPPTLHDLLELAIESGGAAAVERCAQQPASDGCPENWTATIADVLLQRRQLVPAIAMLEADLQRRPTAVDSAVLLGDAYRARGDREAARRAYGEALRRAPRKAAEELTSFADAIVASWRQRAEQALAELDHDAGAKPR
jgi:dienelactone hydrolase